MAKYPLIARVPEIWRKLDLNYSNAATGLLGVVDSEYEHWNSLVEAYLTFLNVDLTSDNLLPILAPLVGYKWENDKSLLRNRDKIRAAIRYASYRGTTDCIEDLLREHGAQYWQITDQASRLDIWNRQGGFNVINGVVMDGNYWHDGAFVLVVDPELDLESFIVDFEDVKPDGTVWFIQQQVETVTYHDMPLSYYFPASSPLLVTVPSLSSDMGTYDSPLVEPYSLMQPLSVEV